MAKTRILLRNDALSSWESSDLVLGKGEIAIATPIEGRFAEIRVGTGSSTWSGASRLNIGAEQVSGLVAAMEGTAKKYQIAADSENGNGWRLQESALSGGEWTDAGDPISVDFSGVLQAVNAVSSNCLFRGDALLLSSFQDQTLKYGGSGGKQIIFRSGGYLEFIGAENGISFGKGTYNDFGEGAYIQFNDESSFIGVPSPGCIKIRNSQGTVISTLADILGLKLEKDDVGISYGDKTIRLSAGTRVTSVDCADFIKDGMLSAVELCAGQLIFDFNTDSGTDPISVALSNFIDETQHYRKSETSSANEISGALAGFYPKSETSSANEISAALDDVAHKDEFYDLRRAVHPFKQIAGKETDYDQYYVCRPSAVTEISGALSGEFDVLLDDYEAANIYRFQFLVGDADAYPKFYIDYGNGPEPAPDLSVNRDSYVFEAGTRYYAEVQNDILKVDTFGYSGGSSLPSRYKLVTAELSSLNGSLCCMIEDHSITTIEISSSSTPVVVYLPEKADDGARDFIIRVEISSQTAPGFTFAGLDESVIFDSEDDDWAVLEPGLNLISFTETK